MSEWKEVIIGEHIDLISGFAFKSGDFLAEQIEGSLPIIKIKNVANGDVNLNDVVYHKYNSNLEKFILTKGDVLIAMTGNHPQAQTQVVGDVSRYKLEEKSLLNQRVGKFIVKNGNSLDFIYYLFKNDDVKFYLANQSSGSGNQANISKTDILGLNLSIPLPKEQTAIASILSSLDDKIDLLHRQNATLEKMAETLFRQWFVEEAKEDWEVGTLGDLGTIITGKTPSNKNPEYWGNEYHFITPTDFKNFGMFTNPPIRGLSEQGWNKLKSLHIPDDSILVTCIGSDMGKVTISSQPCITNQQLNSIVIQDKAYLGYLYENIKNQYENIRNIAFGGTTMPIINKTDFQNIDILIPPIDVIESFNSHWKNIAIKIKSNQTQIRTLTSLRDTLLPKLMSGEVRVAI